MNKPTKQTDSNIPQIILIDDKGEHYEAQGSYCWNNICIDYTMPPRPQDQPEKIDHTQRHTNQIQNITKN